MFVISLLIAGVTNVILGESRHLKFYFLCGSLFVNHDSERNKGKQLFCNYDVRFTNVLDLYVYGPSSYNFISTGQLFYEDVYFGIKSRFIFML